METVIKKRLSNGVTLLFSRIEMRTPKPILFSAMLVGSGASSDPAERKGLAHVSEHVIYRILREVVPMFGPGLRQAAEARRVVYPQARTELDSTHYSLMAPLEFRDEILDFLGKWPSEPLLTDEHVARCVGEVLQEKKQKNATLPFAEPYDALYQLAYSGHPYEAFTVGRFEDVAKITTADVEDFFRTHYQPCNLTYSFVVSGEVSEKDYSQLVERASERMEKLSPISKPPQLVFPALRTHPFREQTRKSSFPQGALLVGIEVPKEVNPFAAQVLLQLLAGPTSPLQGRWKTELEAAAGFVSQAKDVKMLELMFLQKAGSVELRAELLETLSSEFKRIEQGKVDALEFDYARKLSLAEWKQTRATPLGQSEAVASWEVLGPGAEHWADFPEIVAGLNDQVVLDLGRELADPSLWNAVYSHPAE